MSERADDRRAHAAARRSAADVGMSLGEEVPADAAGRPLLHDVDDHERRAGRRRRRTRQYIHARGEAVARCAAGRDWSVTSSRSAAGRVVGRDGSTVIAVGHSRPLSFGGRARSTMPRAAMLTRMVMTNSTTPRPISAARYSAAGLAELVGDDAGHGVAGAKRSA